MTAHWQNPELITDGIIAYITAAQAAKIAAVSAAYTDHPLPMVPFAEIHLSDPFKDVVNDWPALFVMPVDDEQEPNVSGLAGGYWALHRFEFAVLIGFAADVSMTAAETARRYGMRYLGALEEMLVQSYDATLRPWEWGVGETPRRAYGAVISFDSGEWLHDCRLTITCRAKEVAL